MASLQAKVDAVKASVASTSSCTPATVVTLKELLLPEPESQPPRPKSSAARATKTPTSARTKSSAGREKTTASSSSSSSSSSTGELLSPRERTALATHVINVTIKSLTEAAKPAPPAPPAPPSTPSKRNDDLRQAMGKRTLARSNSQPLSPMHPRALNRVASSPSMAGKDSKPPPPSHSTGCLATVECARVAFAALRAVKGPVQPDQTDFQLEIGMSALVGKLLALGMHDQALKELRILKRRLDGLAPPNNAKPSSENNGTTAGMADLLEFHGALPKQSLPTVTGYQMQVLKLIAATKKPLHIESILPHLSETDASSPFNLLSTLAKDGEKEAAKAARQMASLCQILLSLAPSISSQEDIVAVEPRLSPSPDAAFELQSLAFRTQLRWWKLAGHQGNIDDEVLAPFARCVRAYTRRQKAESGSIYDTIATSFEAIVNLVDSHKHCPAKSSNSPLASIYQLLGYTAQAEREYDEAYRWLQSLQNLLTPGEDSSVRICSVSARLLSVALKKPDLDPDDIEQLVREVIEGLDGSLSGTVPELNDLLESLSLTRRSVVGILMNALGPNANEDTTPSSLTDLLKSFILRYPRFIRRWLGVPPGKEAPPKQVLQFDQRRQLVMQSVCQVLDGAFMVIKCDIQSETNDWQTADEVLQHCASVLDSLSATNLGIYRVKISSLYFSMAVQTRKKPNRSKEDNKLILQSLNRSIDAVKDCTAAEKEKAQLTTKLELFADVCKGAGRMEDAVRTLRSICTNMAEDGVLSAVAAALAAQPHGLAWSISDKAAILSRTLRSIALVDKSWKDWTFFLPEAERAAVLEHLMHIGGSGALSQPLRLNDAGLTLLLRIYTLEKYPIRRFRVLLDLFYQNVGEEDELDEILPLVDQALQQIQKKEMGEDVLLVNYVPHLQAYHASISALADTEAPLPSSPLKDAISSWKSMVASCTTRDDVFAKIDDPQMLLDHLRALNELAGLRGEHHLQLSILELSIALSKVFLGHAADGLILGQSHLATQYVNIGLFPQALKTLEQTEELVAKNSGLSRRVLANFHLSQAEYYTGVGDMSAALSCLSKASAICQEPYSSWAESKSQATMMLSLTWLLQSIVTLQTGDIHAALSCIKSGVRMLSHHWAKLESSIEDASVVSDSGMSETSKAELTAPKSRVAGPLFWSLASPLIRSLLHISSVYAHIGMFQETIYYAESAWKIAEGTQSPLYKAQVAAWTGSVYLKGSQLPKALALFKDVESQIPKDICSSRVRFARQIGEFYWEIGEDDKAARFLKMAEETAHLLSRNEQEGAPASGKAPAAVATKGRGNAVSRSTRAATRTLVMRPKTPVAPKTPKRGAAAKSKQQSSADVPSLPKDVYQASLFAAITMSRTLGLIHQKDWASALNALEQLKDLPKLIGVLSQEQVMTAISLIGHSMEQMISDPVFSVMQDSTISFPAVSSSAERASGDRSPVRSPPRKGRSAAATRKTAKEDSTPAFADALKRAQELLMEAHASALSSADSSMVRRISTLLQSTIIFLSATTATKSKTLSQSGLATVAVDMARNVTWRREQMTLTTPAAEPQLAASLAAVPASAQASDMEVTQDMANFQKHYVDSIPKKWSVISISLSDNRHDLCITKFQAGQSPFILRLPLERANSRDAVSEVFNFEHGREELLDIIRLANETSHSARDFLAKGERNAWWAEREMLDSRLKELLVRIEDTWLGGFKGIFSQHRREADLLARFQKRFHQMLDRTLPSRNNVRGKKTAKAAPVTLDPRILDLFIGVGDPTDPACDMDEALNDLLYFVVDILQFHGERNAYDEIDFDAMVVETSDILRGYHAEAHSEADMEDGSHTVLIPDKALHAFPWESLPCMDRLSVSRVPSLACLRQLIMEAKKAPGSEVSTVDGDTDTDTDTDTDRPAGHHVSTKSGTYILNPSSDLKHTQKYFQPAFSSLESWTGITNKEPAEADFEKALSASDIFVYFGHGSGAQYVRGKTIRRLEKCRPATFLMGCSSAALTEAGEFECYGPVWNYMMAGCPAVVGTLWDVTDRDIDRFAGRTFEEWGLFSRGTFYEDGVAKKKKKKSSSSSSSSKGKGKDKGKARGRGDIDDDDDDNNNDDETDRDEDRCDEEDRSAYSLAEAVARARSACRFRYLNAAAVVLYGIPVYIHHER